MPNNYDFTLFKHINELSISIDGWVSPLIIEYAMEYHHDIPSCYWRVKGTLHTFIIPMVRLNYLSAGNYEQHFKKTLEVFREDYLAWKKEEFNVEWMSQYRNQFSKFIIV
jgi:hypothetical protein